MGQSTETESRLVVQGLRRKELNCTGPGEDGLGEVGNDANGHGFLFEMM